MTTLGDDYREQMGHDPPSLPEGDPLHWQWEYRGTPAERALLRAELIGSTEDSECEEPPVFDGQEALL